MQYTIKWNAVINVILVHIAQRKVFKYRDWNWWDEHICHLAHRDPYCAFLQWEYQSLSGAAGINKQRSSCYPIIFLEITFYSMFSIVQKWAFWEKRNLSPRTTRRYLTQDSVLNRENKPTKDRNLCHQYNSSTANRILPTWDTLTLMSLILI